MKATSKQPRSRRGSVSLRLVSTGAGPRWQVYYRDADGQHRQFFKTKPEAQAAKSEIEAQRDAAGHAWLALTSTERARLIQTHQEAKAAGYDLWTLLQEAKSAGKPVHTAPTVKSVIASLIASKAGSSPRYLTNLQQLLTNFIAGRELIRIDQIRTEMIQEWLDAHPGSRTTWRSRLATLFKFAQRRGWIVCNPIDGLDRIRARRVAKVSIFTVEQTKILLESLLAKPSGLAWFTLSTFCGLRPEESAATTWKDIRPDCVVVDAQTSKVRQRRVVYPRQTALDWLAVALKRKAPLPISLSTKKRLQTELRQPLGWKTWPKDVTRHTAATYWLAQTNDTKLVSRMLGNTPEVLETHYLELVTREQAAAFWALTPQALANNEGSTP